MKKLFLFITIGVLSKMLIAQNTYFNERLTNAGLGGMKIIGNYSSYDLITATKGIYLQSSFIRIDSLANILLQKDYGSSQNVYYNGGYGGLNRLKDSSYVYAGVIEDSSGNDVLLYKLSKDGDTLWTRRYGDSLFQSGWMCKPTRDGGFIITGQDNLDVLLLKTDSAGNFQWKKRYGFSGYDLGVAIDTCFDGGFLIGGYTKPAGSTCGDFYILKTDSLGNLKWSRIIGGQYDEATWGCLQAKDGNYIIAGHYCYFDPYPHCNSGYNYSKAYIIKLDTAGKTIWQKGYGHLGLTNIFSIKQLDDGSLISVGATEDTIIGKDVGFILKTNSDGDSIWMRTYSYPGQHASNFYDVTLANDGGFAAIGTVNGGGTQDVWVVKVDSNGCEVANCIFSGVGEVMDGDEDFVVYPNPSARVFYFRNRTNEIIERTEVFNYVGERVFYKEGKIEEIDLLNVSAGIYFYKIETREGKVYSGKMVKE